MYMRALIVAIIGIPSVCAEELKDPRTRVEDISGMTIATKIERAADGQYRYIYTINNPSTSTDAISSFEVDVSCPEMPDIGERNIDGGGSTRDYNYSHDGRHVPLQSQIVGIDWTESGITYWNQFTTMISLPPGHSRTVALTSPNKPGYLPFKVDFSDSRFSTFDYLDEHGSHWKYDPEEFPYKSDWEVHGLVKGPACLGNEATPLTRPIFSGQRMQGEADEINDLLRYEVAGNRNRWHAPASQTELKLRVYYNRDNIDPATFTATLNGRDIKALFHPGSVWDEWVTLPLEGPRTVIELSVEPKPGRYEHAERYPVRRDVDPFEIRRPIAMP